MTNFTLRLIQFTAVIAIAINSTTTLALDLANRTKSDIQLDSSRKPTEIMNFVGVKHGDKVLDLLAGGGYYSELLSRVVGNLFCKYLKRI